MENKNKLPYEEVSVEVYVTEMADILTTSGNEWDDSNVDSGGWT